MLFEHAGGLPTAQQEASRREYEIDRNAGTTQPFWRSGANAAIELLRLTSNKVARQIKGKQADQRVSDCPLRIRHLHRTIVH